MNRLKDFIYLNYVTVTLFNFIFMLHFARWPQTILNNNFNNNKNYFPIENKKLFSMILFITVPIILSTIYL